jgi:hypothetical protein
VKSESFSVPFFKDVVAVVVVVPVFVIAINTVVVIVVVVVAAVVVVVVLTLFRRIPCERCCSLISGLSLTSFSRDHLISNLGVK